MCDTPIEDSTPEIRKEFKKVSVRMRQVKEIYRIIYPCVQTGELLCRLGCEPFQRASLLGSWLHAAGPCFILLPAAHLPARVWAGWRALAQCCCLGQCCSRALVVDEAFGGVVGTHHSIALLAHEHITHHTPASWLP